MSELLSSRQPFVCVDWGALYWRQYTSFLGFAPPEPSLAVCNTNTMEILTGSDANDVCDSTEEYVRFEDLLALFDDTSDLRRHAESRTRALKINLGTILEKWWRDRFEKTIALAGSQQKITFVISHPAHFSMQSVRRIHEFFAKPRNGRLFQVMTFEKSSTAIHGSAYTALETGDVALVLDGRTSAVVSCCQDQVFRCSLIPGLRVSEDHGESEFSLDHHSQNRTTVPRNWLHRSPHEAICGTVRSSSLSTSTTRYGARGQHRALGGQL
jgi:hypothetical protein